MAVAFVDSYLDQGGGSETITLTATGSDRLIFGLISGKSGSSATFTDITINSVSLSDLVSSSIDGGVASSFGYGHLKDANNPGAGAYSMTSTVSPAISVIIYNVIELSGVDQTAPLGNTAQTQDTAVTDGATVSCTLANSQGSFAIVYAITVDDASDANGGHTLPSGATLIGDYRYNANWIRIGYISSIASNSEQLDFTVSANGADAIDSVQVGAIEVNAVGAADTVPPTFESAPAVTATTSSGHTISQTINEGGFIYGVRLTDGATAPTSAQVKSGLDANGDPAPEAKNVTASASTNADLVFSGGASTTAYDYYIVAEDDASPRNLQASPTMVGATTSAVVSEITTVSVDDVIIDAESPVAVTWTNGANGTSAQTPTINSVDQSSYNVSDDSNSSFEFVWPNATYGATVELAIGSYTHDVSVIPQTGRAYVTLSGYVEGSADITATPSLVDGDQLEYQATDTNGNAVSISADGMVTITLASGQTEPAAFDVRAVDSSNGDRGPWQTVSATGVNLGPTISGSDSPSVFDGDIFQVEYTIENMDGNSPTLSGANAGSFTITLVSGDIWRLESTSALAVGTYNVTINADDTVNDPVTLAVVLTVNSVVINGISFADLNPLVNSDTHPTSPSTLRASETFTVDILDGTPDNRILIASIDVTTDANGNLPATLGLEADQYGTVMGETYECALRAVAGDGFVFDRTIVDVS